ncbi:MAG TPA: TetR/AcrR family transcriptional regulator [Roseiflexaceae bacterium]|nr:TetR/AcrR family transcriptional regulator [Roseiflexaceae bacterium]HMP42631.1 TetR/AcrR family transcriptional regulator [Roseiflexaceae bacterium]
MPRGFHEHERVRIRARLQAAAHEGLATIGFRKLSVAAMARAAGISKGAFYLFYASKEELLFDVLAGFEATYHQQLLTIAAQPSGTPPERIRGLLEHALLAWKREPLFRFFGSDEYRMLLQALPPAALAAGMQADLRFAEQLIAIWRAQGMVIEWQPALFVNLMRALFLVALHETDFDPAIYPQMIAELVAMLAARIGQQGGI